MAATVLAGPSGVTAAPCWVPPVAAPVSDPYREPACRWCPGNRGVEYATRPGDPVTAVAAGTVTFAGTVAGDRYVVVEHADGRRATYGRLRATTLARGDRVVRGARIGTADRGFHFGLRDGDRYLDPTPYLGVLRGVVRLVPADGSPAAPAPPPRPVCGGRAPASPARAASSAIEPSAG